jgi:hypothetical protein
MLARVLLVGIVLVAAAGSASAQPKRWRPCGPGDTTTGNRCVPQTFRGVDFRPACQNHDRCYEQRRPQKACDREFRDQMRALCDAGGNPRGCYRRAQVYYLMVRLVGWTAYTGG